ncbi:MAG: ATP-binding protein [Gammaproteobacteria bacterium]|nr:ATP-binding protein [Gammaproteobacteria bacterium]
MIEPFADRLDSSEDGSRETMVANAEPTKEFFIEMLVKDIQLIRAIIDLVDNCVDGARRMRPSGNFDGLTIGLSTKNEEFSVQDNCGGIPLGTARSYAFRFGRPSDAENLDHSVGQFGVGMKRALFKLGSKFHIESGTSLDHFKIDCDVALWKSKPDWTFDFAIASNEPGENIGTKILVSDLHKSVKDDFGLENFQSELARSIRDAHIDSLEAGLSIMFNGNQLTFEPLTLMSSEILKPALFETLIEEEEGAQPISVRIYAGLGESDPQRAGWNAFCNGRLVLGSDQTEATGWGEGNGKTIPKFHNQYATFRGYVFFDCNDASRLPWNTTKTGVDLDSSTFKAIRAEMIKLMRPVINFLNHLDKEKENPDDQRPLHDAVGGMKCVTIKETSTSGKFEYPQPKPRKKTPRSGRIQYNKPIERINIAKKILDIKTHREVGSLTFDYYFDRECT